MCVYMYWYAAGFNPSMQPEGGVATLEIRNSPPGILPRKFMKYDSFFYLHCIVGQFWGVFCKLCINLDYTVVQM